MSRYYRTDEETEAADALCSAELFSQNIQTDLRKWRWTIIALHNAVQGFMVLSLRHGNGLLALTPESMSAWLKAYYEGSGSYPDERLDTYLNLYKKVKTGTAGGATRFVPRGSQSRSIRKLNTLRNEFIHFTPKGWSLEVSGLPRITLDCLTLIAFLGWETTNINWHDESCQDRAKLCHGKIDLRMTELESTYTKNNS